MFYAKHIYVLCETYICKIKFKKIEINYTTIIFFRMSQVKVTTNDSVEITIEPHILNMFGTLKNMIGDIGEIDCAIPLSELSSKTLNQIIVYVEEYLKDQQIVKTDEQKKEFEATKDVFPYAKNVMVNLPIRELIAVLNGLNYLDCKPVLDETTKLFALQIRHKTPEQIKEWFDCKDVVFTDEDKRKVKDLYDFIVEKK